MDINPDQIVAFGKVNPEGVPVRAFDWINRRILTRAKHVVALDRFMAERLEKKAPVLQKLTVMPPWPHIDSDQPLVEHSENPFRKELGLGGKRVVMYSGNLSPTHPVTTILDAATQLRHDERLVFLFIGGGLGRSEIENRVRAHGLGNVRTLPYQPLSKLPYSLAAADVHLVAMGSEMVGIVHPSKIYGAMAAGRPVLALGPSRSHLGEIVLDNGVGWHVDHGDVQAAVNVLETIATAPFHTLTDMGQKARAVIDAHFSRRVLLGRFCDILEQS
jgi:glycosyltransferase involved in cell wall biosynthesis